MGPPDATQLLTHFRSPEHRAGGLVGRARELADLTGALDAAATGDGRLVLLAGEPGIGKTRLADALTGAARERGFRVAWGRCWEAGGAPPHWPWVQVLRSLTEGLEGDALAAALGPHAAGVLALAPELGDRLTGPPEQVASGGDGDGARFAAWDATASFLGAAAAAAPLMIVLDDVHTADRPSLLFLRFLARTLHDRRLLIVATLREAESSAHGELFDELARDGGRLPLRGLGDDEVARLAAAHAGRRPPAAFARELRRVTDGNPFFVVETVRLRVAEAPADPFALPVALPAHALAAVRRRLDPLPAGARDLLAVAAVAGREFDAAVVGSLASVVPDEVAAVLDAATLAGLVERWAGGHRFAHALVRDALYDSLAPSRRAALHEALAVALEKDGADSAHIAHHYSAAGSPRAAGHARAAGDDAAARLAYEDAALHYEHALEGAL
ncbi:MAG: hypothetical protein QOJ07_2755, partial [Thermoleophilaceae bacterium]|nr:hypothetical protein [Thermoleophilaceae bacterium]